jgi:hypothetical protein
MDTSADNQTTRRFNLGDGLILIGALALALSMLQSSSWFERVSARMRFWHEACYELTGHIPQPLLSRYPRDYLKRLVASEMLDESLQQLLGPVICGLTLAQPLLRLRPPRPSFKDMVRQAGF